jgi:hypothetical protein
MILDYLLNAWKIRSYLGTIEGCPDFEEWVNSMSNLDLIRYIDEALERARDD